MTPPQRAPVPRNDRLVIEHLAQADERRDFLAAVAAGLAAHPKRIAPKFFYDAVGSGLFERITDTPEYYPTRTEAALLERHGAEMLAAAGRPACLVELGSGSARKTRPLLERMARDAPRVEYVPIDVSPASLAALAEGLLAGVPRLAIHGLVGDYHQALQALKARAATPKLFLFLGSSLGNYDLPGARALLALVRGAMGPADAFLLGLDRIKDPAVLHAAYNDAEGVTAAFNLNLLARINRELGGHFDLARFRHVAFYDGAARRIEMHLESLASQTVAVDALGQSYGFAPGERLHTENSHKYDDATIAEVTAGAGLRVARRWTDERGWFEDCLLTGA
jgi:dimethylhistidine N-methyltransferase